MRRLLCWLFGHKVGYPMDGSIGFDGERIVHTERGPCVHCRRQLETKEFWS